MTFQEAYDLCMPPKKREKEQYNIWVAWVVRPLSVLLTLPLINTKIKPSDITKLSIICSFVGFTLLAYPTDNIWISISGWLCFFVWAILDGVDGNLARCQNTCSPMGELWDAIGGYAAMILIFMSAGIKAYFDTNLIELWSPYIVLIVCGFSSIASLYPRLIMHKKQNIIHYSQKNTINDKAHFALKEILIMNLISVSGFLQVIFLISILTHTLNIFTYAYFIVNVGIMIISIRRMIQ